MSATAVLVLLSLSVQAAEAGVLIEHVPRGAQQEIVIAVIRQAFVGRRWTVDKVGQNSVSAYISRSNIGVSLTISFVDGTLRYQGEAETRSPAGGNPAQPRTTRVPRSLPENWIENLRQDIGRMLATIPDR